MQLHHSPASTAKKLWNYLRFAFFMARRGFASKGKLVADVSLLMKRGRLLGRSLSGKLRGKLLGGPQDPPLVRREYEFSCSNSPAYPVLYRGGKRRRCSYFPCLHAVVVEETDDALAAAALRSIDNSARMDEDHHHHHHHYHLAPTPPLGASPLSVRIVSYLSDGDDVDEAAEEFIRRFYEQLRAQSRVALML